MGKGPSRWTARRTAAPARQDDREKRLLLGSLSVLTACVCVAALVSTSDQWQPLSLVVALALFAVTAEALPMAGPAKGGLFTSSAPYALSMCLLGPAPAVMVGVLAITLAYAREGKPASTRALGAANYAFCFLTGGLGAQAAIEHWSLTPHDPAFALVIVATYAWIFIASSLATDAGFAWLGEFSWSDSKRLLRVQLGAEVPSAFLAAATAYAYSEVSVGAVALLGLVQLTFQYFGRALLMSEVRGDDLAQRASELSALHDQLADQIERIAILSASRSKLVGQVLEAEERERRRLAEALHDEALQNLFVAERQLARAGQDPGAVSETLQQLRDVIFELHPSVLEHAGLASALKTVAKRHAQEAGFEVHVEVGANALSSHDGLLFSLAREQLSNVAKHAAATSVTLSVRRLDDSVVMQVHDDGCGLNEVERRQAVAHGHIGLASSVERVESLGGQLQLSSSPGGGTRIRTQLPWPTSGADHAQPPQATAAAAP